MFYRCIKNNSKIIISIYKPHNHALFLNKNSSKKNNTTIAFMQQINIYLFRNTKTIEDAFVF
jgi:hypothetical protein